VCLLRSFSGISAHNTVTAQPTAASAETVSAAAKIATTVATATRMTTTLPTTTRMTITTAATTTNAAMRGKHSQTGAGQPSHCVGTVSVAGHGSLQVLQAVSDANGHAGGTVAVHNTTTVFPSKAGKAYFGEACTGGRAYSNTEYAAISLVNSTFSYTVDLSATNCGCVVSLKFVSMRQNKAPGLCHDDFYCDAVASCGSACSEVNVMQANRFMWKTTMRTPSDSDERESILKGDQYHPGSSCIDTNRPFRVSAVVSLDASSLLVRLTQGTCWLEAATLHTGMAYALRMGMTPVLSYTRNIKALDRQTCKGGYLPQMCPASVKFGDLALRSGYNGNGL